MTHLNNIKELAFHPPYFKRRKKVRHVTNILTRSISFLQMDGEEGTFMSINRDGSPMHKGSRASEFKKEYKC